MRAIPRSKKGAGVVSSTVFGIGGLIIAVILIFVITTTLNDSQVLTQYQSATVTNETGIYLNGTTYTVTTATAQGFKSFTITGIVDTYDNSSLAVGNITAGSTTGTVVNASADANASNEHYITYTYQYYTTEQGSVENLMDNMTSGVTNVGNKIPTILLLVAVVFLFGALVLLVRQSKLMGIGKGSL